MEFQLRTIWSTKVLSPVPRRRLSTAAWRRILAKRGWTPHVNERATVGKPIPSRHDQARSVALASKQPRQDSYER
jgi:hypothetical protein